MKNLLWCMAGLLGLAACGGGGGGGGGSASGGEASAALVVAPTSELVSYVQGRLRAQGAAAGTLYGALPVADVAAMGAGTAPHSATTLQEAGVDEPDLLQSDGSHLYTLQPQGSGARVQVYGRGTDGRALPLVALDLPDDGQWGQTPEGLVFNADQRALAVLTRRWQAFHTPAAAGDAGAAALTLWPGWLRASYAVQRLEAADPATARLGTRVEIDGQLIDSRRIGNRLLVLSNYTPTLRVHALPAGSAEREAAIAALRGSDLLPQVRRNGGAAAPLLADNDCWLQPANGSTTVQITTVTVFDLGDPALPYRSRCFVGGSEALYMSAQHLYLATTRTTYAEGALSWTYPPDVRTDLHKFALAEDGSLSWRASGQVAGHLGWDTQRKPYRLSEHNGDLRVLSFTGREGWATVASDSTPPSPALLTVLRERSSDRSLQAVSTLPNARRSAALGKPGEQVHGVRFDGARGYLVTFRRIDPLYVLDLADPADPQVAGVLEVPGFSDQLFPLPQGLLLGVGRAVDDNGRTGGVKLSLFDVANAAQPRELASTTLGDSGSGSALDGSRHGLNWLMQGAVARLALPVRRALADPSGAWSAAAGLQRFEVDTQARTLRVLPAVGERTGWDSVWAERSLQIGDQAYYLSQGALTAHDW